MIVKGSRPEEGDWYLYAKYYGPVGTCPVCQQELKPLTSYAQNYHTLIGKRVHDYCAGGRHSPIPEHCKWARNMKTGEIISHQDWLLVHAPDVIEEIK